VGVDGEMERAADLQPDRYYLLGDAGSFFFDQLSGAVGSPPLHSRCATEP
jgi:hypothetical protein